MDKEILDLLESIYEQRKKGISVDSENLYRTFDKTLVKKAIHWKLIGFSGTDYYLTDVGFNTLNQGRISKNTEQLREIMDKMLESIKKSGEITDNFSASSKKQNKEMISHTKTMKKLTWWILGFTIINLILLAIQILKLLNIF